MDLWSTLAHLDALGLPRDQYAVFGSGPLAVRNLRPAGDLDLIVLPTLWTHLAARYPVTQKGALQHIALGNIEIWPDWHSAAGPVAALIADADLIGGYRFVTVARTLAWKRALARPKDLADVALIEHHLAMGGA